MQEFGEQVLADMHFHDGETGASMHNRLPVLYDLATRQVVSAYEQTHPDRHIFFFTRAGYTGTPGDAAYESANFHCGTRPFAVTSSRPRRPRTRHGHTHPRPVFTG